MMIYKIFVAEKQPLPPGVTEQDVEMYREIREKAAKAVSEVMNPGGKLNLAAPAIANPQLLSPTSLAIAAQERCPAAIEFGQWEIKTWYSSPFPQEYARYDLKMKFIDMYSQIVIFFVQITQAFFM